MSVAHLLGGVYQKHNVFAGGKSPGETVDGARHARLLGCTWVHIRMLLYLPSGLGKAAEQRTVRPCRGQGTGLVPEQPVVGMVGWVEEDQGGWPGRAAQANVQRPWGAQSRGNTLGCPVFLVWLWVRPLTSLSPTFPVGSSYLWDRCKVEIRQQSCLAHGQCVTGKENENSDPCPWGGGGWDAHLKDLPSNESLLPLDNYQSWSYHPFLGSRRFFVLGCNIIQVSISSTRALDS